MPFGKPEILCEGAAGAFAPAVIYVRQGDKVFFFKGKPGELRESLADVQIVESLDGMDLVETSAADGHKIRRPRNGRWVVEGPGQRSDVVNANKRKYSRKLWEKLIADGSSYVQKNIGERRMLGHAEHPEDGRTDLKESALLTTNAKLLPDGTVWGSWELLDTPNGLILQEHTIKDIPWGVSTRGTGSVDAKGDVGEDYKLIAWDAVASPSTPGAFPKPLGTRAIPEDGATPESETAEVEEDVERHMAHVRSLTESPVTESGDARTGRIKEMLAAFGRTNEMLRARKLDGGQAADIYARIQRSLAALHEGIPDPTEAAVDAAIAAAIRETTEDAPGADVIEELAQQVKDSTTESEKLRRLLEVSESDTRVLRDERDRYAEQLAEAESEAARLRQLLATAEGLLSERFETNRQHPEVRAAVDEAVDQVPGLERYRAALMRATDALTVALLAEALLPAVVGRGSPTPQPAKAPQALTSHRLPTGQVASDDLPPRLSEQPLTEGASLAAQVVKARAH